MKSVIFCSLLVTCAFVAAERSGGAVNYPFSSSSTSSSKFSSQALGGGHAETFADSVKQPVVQALPANPINKKLYSGFSPLFLYFPAQINVYFCNLYPYFTPLYITYQAAGSSTISRSATMLYKNCTKLIAVDATYLPLPLFKLYADNSAHSSPDTLLYQEQLLVVGTNAENWVFAFENVLGSPQLVLPLEDGDIPYNYVQQMMGNMAVGVESLVQLRDGAPQTNASAPGEIYLQRFQIYSATVTQTWKFINVTNGATILSQDLQTDVSYMPAQQRVVFLIGRAGDPDFPLSIFAVDTIIITYQYSIIAHLNDVTTPILALNGTWSGSTQWSAAFYEANTMTGPVTFMTCLEDAPYLKSQKTKWTFYTSAQFLSPGFKMAAEMLSFLDAGDTLTIPQIDQTGQYLVSFDRGCLVWVDHPDQNTIRYARVKFNNATSMTLVECPRYTASGAEETWLAQVCPEMADYPTSACVPDPYIYTCNRYEFRFVGNGDSPSDDLDGNPGIDTSNANSSWSINVFGLALLIVSFVLS